MNEIAELMRRIVDFDCKPGVFKVFLVASDHETGFRIEVSFRQPHDAIGRTIFMQGEDPIAILRAALAELEANYGRCPHCGNYRGITQ